MSSDYDKRSAGASRNTKPVAAIVAALRHQRSMIGHDDLIRLLRERRDAGDLSNADVAAVLRVPSSRAAEIFSGKRLVKLDEAKAIVDRFNLEGRAQVSPPPSEAIEIVLDELLRSALDKPLAATTLRPLAEALRRALQLLSENPAIHANQDAVKVLAQALASPPPSPMPGA